MAKNQKTDRMQDIRISWNATDRGDWDKAHLAARGSYQQDWAYGVALKRLQPHLRVLRASARRSDGSLVGLAQIVARPFAQVCQFALCTHGPVWAGEVSVGEKAATLGALKVSLPLRWPKLLVLTPDEPAGEAGHLRRLKRVMTGDATVLIDLTLTEAELRARLDQGWRNRLTKAERSGLVVQKGGLRAGQYRWLLDAEAKQRQTRGYRAMPLAMTEFWQDAKADAAAGDRAAGLAVYRIDIGRNPAAAMMFLVHGGRATYYVGWSSDEGRALAAHNLILWRAICDFRSRGIEALDLGGVNTQSGAGIARFKIETGGDVLIRPGAYV